jgi:hypothetical protein
MLQLDFQSNMVTDVGAIRLASTLKRNPVLGRLIIGSNQIGPAGAVALADALTANTNLEEILMGFNQIGDEGMQAFLKAMEFNRGLLKVFFGQNGVTDKVRHCLSTSFHCIPGVVYAPAPLLCECYASIEISVVPVLHTCCCIVAC